MRGWISVQEGGGPECVWSSGMAGQENWPGFLKASPLVSEAGSRESVGSCRVTAKCRVPQSLMK